MSSTTKAAVIEALEFYANPEVYKPDSTGRVDDVTFVAAAALKLLRSEPEPTPEPGERERFEAWYETDEAQDAGISHGWQGIAWAAWQAARASLPPAPEPVAGWQSIETAPKDGRTMLVGYFNSNGKWRTMRGRWYSQETIEDEWEDPDLAGEGWYETVVESDDYPNCWWTEPTHWMPLPPAPTKGTE